MRKTTKTILTIGGVIATAAILVIGDSQKAYVEASSHREAPLIANDPLADNTDLYAFRSPDDTNTVTIIANYVPLQLPQGGPNYASFGENIRYEIHIENDGTAGDDITYRFTFSKVNEDTTTFFNIRLGKQNLKTTYVAEKSINGGAFTPIVTNGSVPPPNIGPRSIEGNPVGLDTTYAELITNSIATAIGGGGETVFCGPSDDPFFVDLGAIFDLGGTRGGQTGSNAPIDGVKRKNVHTIAIKVPIATLQKNGVNTPANILDGDYIIGVWASASRPSTRTLSLAGANPSDTGTWVQVSRLGMPLTNEAIIPIGSKDLWNSLTPYNEGATIEAFFTNPELALYVGGGQYGAAVPAFSALKLQDSSATVLGKVNFQNGNDGLFAIYGHPATNGSALDTTTGVGFGKYLLRDNAPRSADLLPIFFTGVPNRAPYQLATGKTDGNPFTAGKPFINNFLPTFGDMLRLNMAVPVTPRTPGVFSSLGLVAAAVTGLTDPAYANTSLQFIPNMDGFPNGRRLEDDVTRIELQAVGGVVLAAIGLWYDDRPIGANPVSADLGGVLAYTTGVEANDTTFKTSFPYVQTPWSGYGKCGSYVDPSTSVGGSAMGIGAPALTLLQNYPNPFRDETTFKYRLTENGHVDISIFDLTGKKVATLINQSASAGTYEIKWNAGNSIGSGMYIASLSSKGKIVQTMKISVNK